MCRECREILEHGRFTRKVHLDLARARPQGCTEFTSDQACSRIFLSEDGKVLYFYCATTAAIKFWFGKDWNELQLIVAEILSLGAFLGRSVTRKFSVGSRSYEQSPFLPMPPL